ncbi:MULTISPECIES: DEAD/DEAH box helicase [unclassified Rathayibacter]|uniref:DEAD/DEAH box helicase n=1 Tax=unclassified Rathayibacter TaxID=2609250 RepID=UPI000F4738B7|nr:MULTISPECIES: DEAD/DEAH box helicase family protein [unclassified Rathayibacter]
MSSAASLRGTIVHHEDVTDLRGYVLELQATAIDTYRRNRDLLEEHVRQEDSYRFGGYGTRQVSELLQNAADAMGTDAGRVEFRVADRALYCANEGAPFNRDGVRAVSMAFLSEKRGEQIGRFGLGFKSLLGITNNPQIHSRDASFQFNGDDVAVLFEGMESQSGRLPVMRVPTPVDTDAAQADDPHLAELLGWASTVIKVPLVSGGTRIRDELRGLNTELLLFMRSIRELVVSLQNADGSLNTMKHTRDDAADRGEVRLMGPDGKKVRWLLAERRFEPSSETLATLPDTARRNAMTVSYAVPPGTRAALGQFWAWFPLSDRTTASGIFNAPWQVNDDRTTMLAGSRLNGEMLDVCAELFLDVAIRSSDSKDPAAHLDLFPGRGREIRGPGDHRLSEAIPRLARSREIIPDASGVLRTPGEFSNYPEAADEDDGRAAPATEQIVALWQEQVARIDTPHAGCYRTRTRSSRLRTLTRETGERTGGEVRLDRWLEELAAVGTPAALVACLEIVAALKRTRGDDAVRHASIVPTSAGRLSIEQAVATALLPVDGFESPEGIPFVDPRFAREDSVRARLVELGMRSASATTALKALVTRLSDRSPDKDWNMFWSLIEHADRDESTKVIDTLRLRASIKVASETGELRRASDLFASSPFSGVPPERRAAAGGVPMNTLVAAGCLQATPRRAAAENDGLFAGYRTWLVSEFVQAFRTESLRLDRVELEQLTTLGPLDILPGLVDAPRDAATWTHELVGRGAEARHRYTAVAVGGKKASAAHFSFERWVLSTHGRVKTSNGIRRPGDFVGAGLMRFGAFLPVADAKMSEFFEAPEQLVDVADALLLRSFSPDVIEPGSKLDQRQLVEFVVAVAGRLKSRPARIPAFSRGSVTWVPTGSVFVAQSEDIADLDELEIAWLPANVPGVESLADRWRLQEAQVALAKSIDIEPGTPPELVEDMHPSLRFRYAKLENVKVARSPRIVRRLSGPHGSTEQRLRRALSDDRLTIFIDSELDSIDTLLEIFKGVGLGLSANDAARVLHEDESLRKTELVNLCRAAETDSQRLLLLAGVKALREELPKGLLEVVEERQGEQPDVRVAEIFLEIHGDDALWVLRKRLDDLDGVPKTWAGTDAARGFVENLGFPIAFAGSQQVSKPRSVQIQGKIELSGLHDFQEDLAAQIRELVMAPGVPQRALLTLPTGAGKTRVSVEAVIRMILAGELSGPILWIAQSEELCEQAIQTWTDVWRALGDARVLEISRFWGDYAVEEADADFQLVVAIDDKVSSQISRSASRLQWLSDPSLVVIDEAHTATSKTYTEILSWLGLTASQTSRTLLGLTATAFKGRGVENNRTLAQRFGERRLEAFPAETAVSELRSRGVLSDIDHRVLAGGDYEATDQELADLKKLKEVNRSLLERIGADLERTQLLLDDLLAQPTDWPILVFTPSVASAHTMAALLRLEGRSAESVDGGMRRPARRAAVERFKSGEAQFLINCDLLTQGFDAPTVRALYIARPTFSPNRYIQMVGRGLRGHKNGGTDICTIVNVADTFDQFGIDLAYTEFDYLWEDRS